MNSPTTAKRVAGTFFFLVFLGMGLLFCFFIGRDVAGRVQTHFWNRIDCVILESSVESDGGQETPYRFRVRYAYQWQDRTYTGERWSRFGRNFSDYAEAQRLAGRFPTDTKAICYVNPSNPAEAVLERSSLWISLFMLLPLVFVGIGGAGLAALWRRPAKPKPEESAGVITRPISTRATARMTFGSRATIFGLLFVAGCVVGYFLLMQPLARVQAAKSWPARPCTVLSSEVRSHRGKNSTTYSVDILYSYEVSGREFRSNRYKFLGGSSSGRQGKAEIVRRYPAGRPAVCYVNPADPTDAVLERGLTADMWLGLIPIGLMLAGGGGLISTWRSHRSSTADALGAEAAWPPVPASDQATGLSSARAIVEAEMAGSSPALALADPLEPRVLKPSGSRIVSFVFFLIFGGIWNGFLYFGFLRHSALFGRGRGDTFDWVTTLFLLPFLAVGAGLVAFAIYQFLALYNPKAELTIKPGAPALGGMLEVSWRLIGRQRPLRALKIYLEGREEATHRQGTRTQTDSTPFLTLELALPETAAHELAGQARLTLPADTMPSFKSANNRIVWAIHVRGEIPRWPDLKEEFEVQVRPGARTASA